MKKIKIFFFNFTSIIIIILIFDLLYTNISFSKYFGFLLKEKKDLSKYYEKNDLNKAVLKKDLDNYFFYNKFKYKVCTDKFGFRNFCKIKNSSKKLGTVFAGDSILFGMGIDIEDTFFGIVKKKLIK